MLRSWGEGKLGARGFQEKKVTHAQRQQARLGKRKKGPKLPCSSLPSVKVGKGEKEGDSISRWEEGGLGKTGARTVKEKSFYDYAV